MEPRFRTRRMGYDDRDRRREGPKLRTCSHDRWRLAADTCLIVGERERIQPQCTVHGEREPGWADISGISQIKLSKVNLIRTVAERMDHMKSAVVKRVDTFSRLPQFELLH